MVAGFRFRDAIFLLQAEQEEQDEVAKRIKLKTAFDKCSACLAAWQSRLIPNLAQQGTEKRCGE